MVKEIHISMLVNSRLYPRVGSLPYDLTSLCQSLIKEGYQKHQPILVRQIEPDEYEVLSGWRRVCACFCLGIISIPCEIREMTDQEAATSVFSHNHSMDRARSTV
jgi:ParB-like chromosome segregation protein Spo0J